MHPTHLTSIFHYFFISDTVREMEEVSCSDEEPEVVAPAPSKPEPVPNSSKAGKKKISPPAGKKQGSILSFFSKK